MPRCSVGSANAREPTFSDHSTGRPFFWLHRLSVHPPACCPPLRSPSLKARPPLALRNHPIGDKQQGLKWIGTGRPGEWAPDQDEDKNRGRKGLGEQQQEGGKNDRETEKYRKKWEKEEGNTEIFLRWREGPEAHSHSSL